MSDQPFYAPGLKRPPPRQPVPGFKRWELRRGDRVIVGEFRDDGRAGAGIDVQLLENGELLVSTRCLTSCRTVRACTGPSRSSCKEDGCRLQFSPLACAAGCLDDDELLSKPKQE